MFKKVIKNEKYREVNKCIYCKHWLGTRPEIQSYNWTCTYRESEASCALDETDSPHISSDLCHRFEKKPCISLMSEVNE